jgi:GntR family transcriptional regulator
MNEGPATGGPLHGSEPMDFFKQKHIDKSIPVPLYYQLKEIVLEYIRLSKDRQSLPAEVELCRHFDVSRPTVRQAMSALVAEGYLQRIKGKGTTITQSKINQGYLPVIESFHDEMVAKGFKHDTRVLEFRTLECPEELLAALQLPADSRVIKLVRLRSIGDEPMILLKTYLPAALFPDILDKDLANNSLYSLVEHDYGYSISRSSRTIEAIKADKQTAELLHIEKDDPVQCIESRSFLNDGRVFESTLALYRGDRNRFAFEMSKKRAS